MSIKPTIFYAAIFLPLALKSQHTVNHTNMIWTGYYNTISLNKKWSLISDAQIRTNEWTSKLSQVLVRSGLSYKINNHVAVTGGFAFLKNAQYIEKELLLKNEWRPWQEFSYQTNFKKIKFIQRLRTEQRFLQQIANNKLSDQYTYIFRLRYRSDFQFPLKNNNIKILAGNEVLVNPGYLNNNRFFDQNRTYAAININTGTNTILQLQYLKIFQWHSNTSVRDDANVFRLNIYQQFNFKKNQHKK